jgi:hypothetical protein
MKRLSIVFATSILIFSAARSQQIIENPAQPKSKSAGRIVKLERLLSIKDAGPDSPFRGPYDLQVGNDGSIYFYDNFEFFRFGPDGKFIFKVIRPGQGPGEASMRTVALVTDDAVVIQAGSPPKIMSFDLSGHLKDEKRLESTQVFDDLFISANSIFGLIQGRPPEPAEIKEGYLDVPAWLYKISADFQNQVRKISFPIQNYILQSGGVAWPRASLDFALKDDETLFVSHTAGYGISKCNLRSGSIEKIFKRKYARVKLPQKKEPPRRPGVLEAPPYQYYYDIGRLLVYKDQLWAVTSTRDSNQSRLVDVYDMDGHYIDNFYLQYPEGLSHAHFSSSDVTIAGDFLYSIDEERDGTMSVNKYRILYSSR